MNKGLETLKYLRECIGDRYYKNELDIIGTALKAFEIIKKKGLSILHKLLIISSKNYEEYRHDFQLLKPREFKNEYYYTQDEYDLLKEVLL